jgi:D-alanyl-D-alanine carboxypeptidase (penicillin-binding protein 5/6)
LKKTFGIILTIIMLCAVFPARVRAASYDFSAYPEMGVLVREVASGDAIISNNASATYYPGSITKLMTIITALDYLSLEDSVTVTKAALALVQPNSSLADLVEGEVLTVEQLIYGAVIPSGNDAAIVIAIAAGRKILESESASEAQAYAAFIDAMNAKAQQLNMTASHFSTADGYDDYNNYSTPEDLVILGVEALHHSIILEAADESSYTVTTNKTTHTWQSTDYFLYQTFDTSVFTDISGATVYYDARVYGLKSGYTDIGLRCFLFAAQDGEKSFVGVVLKVPVTDKTEIWRRTSAIINYAFDNYTVVDLVTDDNEQQKVAWLNPSFLMPAYMKLRMKYDASACVENEIAGDIDMKIEPCEGVSTMDDDGRFKLVKDVEEGDTVAYAVFYSGSVEIKRVALIAVSSYDMGDITDIILYVFLIAIIAGIVISLRNVEKKRAKSVE